MRTGIASICLLLIALATGCNTGPEIIPITTAKVTGTATYDGKPLEDYRVFFYLEEHDAQEPASARIAADGSFSLSVRETDDGAMIGTNKVWFRYDPEVPEQVPGMEVPFELPSPKVKLPKEFLDPETSDIQVVVPEEGLTDFAIELP